MSGKKIRKKSILSKIKRKQAKASFGGSPKGQKKAYFLSIYCPKHGDSKVSIGQGCPGCVGGKNELG